MVWGIIRPWLKDKLRDRVRVILDLLMTKVTIGESGEAKEELSKFLNEDAIPAKFGGSAPSSVDEVVEAVRSLWQDLANRAKLRDWKSHQILKTDPKDKS